MDASDTKRQDVKKVYVRYTREAQLGYKLVRKRSQSGGVSPGVLSPELRSPAFRSSKVGSPNMGSPKVGSSHVGSPTVRSPRDKDSAQRAAPMITSSGDRQLDSILKNMKILEKTTKQTKPVSTEASTHATSQTTLKNDNKSTEVKETL